MRREASTSATVIGSRKEALGLRPAHSRCTTATIANCSCVMP